MNITLKMGLSALAFAAFAMPASAAVSVVEDKCVSVSDSAGCLYDGNINGPNTAETAADYNALVPVKFDAPIVLNYLGQDDEGFGTVVFGDGSESFGTWSTPGFLVDFLAVKAGNNFVLYKLAAAASSGNWDTFDLPFQRNPRELSHIAFFGSKGTPPGGVPEPATWAMLIAGFGMVGSAMRRRRGTVAHVAA